tara:strand:+ start:51 stop:353 length:303 start_codon:yes stop_codon:yes gene_type:complete
MSGSDYDAIKEIIDDIVGDTHQGNVLLKAINAYYTEKETIKVVKYDQAIKSPKFSVFKKMNTNHFKDAEKAMEKYTKRLAKENEKFRNKNGRAKTCSVSS